MDNSEKLFQAGMSCLQSNPDEAARLFGEAVKDNNPAAMFFLAQLNSKNAFSGATIENAVKLYTTLAKEHNDPQAKFELGAMLCYGDKVEWNPEEGSKWIKEFEDDTKGNDNLPFYYYDTLGDLYCKGGLRRSDDPVNNVTVEDLEKAIEYLEKAVAVADSSVNPVALSLTKKQLALQKERLQVKKQIAHGKKQIQLLLGDPQEEGSSSAAAQKPAPAETDYDEYDEAYEAYLSRGYDYADKNDWNKAIQEFTQAIKMKPDDAEAYSYRGGVYLEKGDNKRAIEDLSRAISLKPDLADDLKLPKKLAIKVREHNNPKEKIRRSLIVVLTLGIPVIPFHEIGRTAKNLFKDIFKTATDSSDNKGCSYVVIFLFGILLFFWYTIPYMVCGFIFHFARLLYLSIAELINKASAPKENAPMGQALASGQRDDAQTQSTKNLWQGLPTGAKTAVIGSAAALLCIGALYACSGSSRSVLAETEHAYDGQTETVEKAAESEQELAALKQAQSFQPPAYGDVYAAGYEYNAQGKPTATVWKNGNLHWRLSENYEAEANAVFLSSNDVYIAGYERNAQGKTVAMVWKNGNVHWRLSDTSTFRAIFASGSDVYVTGEQGALATVWKNGNVHWRLNDGIYEAVAGSIFVSGNDVYVAGRESNAQGKFIATVWKNGNVHWRLSDGYNDAYTHSIFVSGNDVYVAKRESNAQGKFTATVWKNGNAHWRLGDGYNDTRAYSIFASGYDVYAAGVEINAQNKAIATVWKNGGVHWRLGNGYNDTRAYSIFVSGNDVYVAGNEVSAQGKAIAMVWKNGGVHWRLNDGYKDANVWSVFIK